MFTAKSGDAELITSGSIIPLENEPVEIKFAPDNPPSGYIRMVLQVVKDSTDSSSRYTVSGDPADRGKVLVTFYNYSSPLGGGTHPLPIWQAPAYTIMIQVRLYTSDYGPPLFHFSIYRKNTGVTA